MALPNTPNSDYADCISPQMALVNENKCHHNKDLLKFNRDTAFHFDATKFGLWLRDHYCLPRGVKHIKEDIKIIDTDKNGIKYIDRFMDQQNNYLQSAKNKIQGVYRFYKYTTPNGDIEIGAKTKDGDIDHNILAQKLTQKEIEKIISTL